MFISNNAPRTLSIMFFAMWDIISDSLGYKYIVQNPIHSRMLNLAKLFPHRYTILVDVDFKTFIKFKFKDGSDFQYHFDKYVQNNGEKAGEKIKKYFAAALQISNNKARLINGLEGFEIVPKFAKLMAKL